MSWNYKITLSHSSNPLPIRNWLVIENLIISRKRACAVDREGSLITSSCIFFFYNSGLCTMNGITSKRNMTENVLMGFVSNMDIYLWNIDCISQGSQRPGNSWKTWKMKNAFSRPGKIMEFEKKAKIMENHGIKIRHCWKLTYDLDLQTLYR